MYQSKTKKYKNIKGFMITEVLITMLLIVIAMVGIVPILFQGVKTSKFSKFRAVGSNIVQKEIERFNQDRFSNVLARIEAGIPSHSPPITIIEFEGTDSSVILPVHRDPTKDYIDSIVTIYINPTNGNISDLSKAGYKSGVISKTYSFLRGEPTIMDDSIRLSVSLTVNGEKPVNMTSILSRDKLN
ncbi:MAG: hypothetical protein H7263_01210 [Candidatus Sericytochromatia bacterium]|nr:hypothetical protein [Candidatus Sericytochromatia bacterium]